MLPILKVRVKRRMGRPQNKEAKASILNVIERIQIITKLNTKEMPMGIKIPKVAILRATLTILLSINHHLG